MTTNNKTTWRTVRLDEGEGLSLIIDHRGITPKKLGGHWVTTGVPALSAKNIKNGQIVNSGAIRYVEQSLYEKWMPMELEGSDILLTSEAPLGETYFLRDKKKYCLSQRLFALRANAKILDPHYLYYYLSSVKGQHELMQRISGTAAQGIRQAELRKIQIDAPINICVQKEIAVILSTFDEKIENNNRIIKALEEMAHAIFKEWFVVPIRAAELSRGWNRNKISNIATLNRGVSYSSKEINGPVGAKPLVNLANFVRGGGFKVDGIKNFAGRFNANHIVRAGQTVLAMTDITHNREVVGHPARIPESLDGAVISLDVCSVETESKYNEFLYFLMLRRSFAAVMASSATGTNVSHLSKGTVESFEFVLPPDSLLEKFNYLIRPLLLQKDNLEVENQRLTAMRDLLLPRLMGGEIFV